MPTKISFKVTADMHQALTDLARKQGATLANYMRMLAEQRLREENIQINTRVSWGGDRKTGE